MDADGSTARWGSSRKLLFRFTFLYSVLYILPFPFDALPYELLPKRCGEWVASHVLTPYANGMDRAVKWIGQKCFDLDITIGPAGSGDTTWNYVQLAGFAAVALAGALLWLAVDRRRPDDSRLHTIWRVLVRYKLAATLLAYGANKVIKLQFAAPTLDDLMQPLGNKSPMGLCWTFIGFSTGYTIFSGAAEMAGGLLLATRRTTTLGALVGAAVMTNVAALNFFYDVPVKLYSAHLLLMALLLVLPDARRLLDFLVLHRPTATPPLERLCA